MSSAYLVVDGNEYGDAYTETRTLPTLEDAQFSAAALSREWREAGWYRQGVGWVHGKRFRQITIVFNGIEMVQEDGEDE